MNIFRSLRHKNFRLQVIGQSISLLGTWMQRIAISWLVYKLTDSVFLLGFVTFISLLPSLVLSPFIGSLIDKYPKFKVLVVTQAGLMIQAALLTLLVFFHYESVLTLSLLGFLQGVINAFDVLARQAIIVSLVEDKNDLTNAIALNSSVFNAARMVGPAIGGFVLSQYGELASFFLNFISYIPVLIALKMMDVIEPPIEENKQSNWQGFVEGFQYLKRSPHLASLIILLSFSSVFVIPYTSLLPAIAKEMFAGDATVFSWFESVAGFGAMIGAFRMASLKVGTNLRYRVLFSAFFMGVSLLFLAGSQALFFGLFFTMLVSFAMMMQNSSINMYLQTHTAEKYRARTIGYYIMAFQGIFPIGSLLMGALAEFLGIRVAMYIMGATGILIAASYYLYIRMNIKRRLFLE